MIKDKQERCRFLFEVSEDGEEDQWMSSSRTCPMIDGIIILKLLVLAFI